MNIINIRPFRNVAAITEEHGVQGEDWLYIGRRNRFRGLEASPLHGIPRLVNEEPGATLPAYKAELWAKMQAGDQEVLEALRQAHEVGCIACYCQDPSKCHGSVVSAAAEWLHNIETEALA